MSDHQWGMGSMRERRPGVWEIRITAGTDPRTGNTHQKSVTFHGTEPEAVAYRTALSSARKARRSITRPAPQLTVESLLERWLAAEHPWKPSTRIGYVSNARHLTADRLAGNRVVDLTPHVVRTAFERWQTAGATPSVIAGRFRVLRSAISWAYDERIIDDHPLRNMRGPGRVEPRRPVRDEDLAALLRTAEARVLESLANDNGRRSTLIGRHRAEQDLLLVRMAADSGARRGELTALRFDDLDQRVLTISRSVSGDVITTPKSGRARSLTLGTATARLWQTLATEWQERTTGELGPWVFSPDTQHQRRLTAGALGHRFERLRNNAGVTATLHQLRHNVATFLVARGDILAAQARLGHADAATTLREYAYALPLNDTNIADALDHHLDTTLTSHDEHDTNPDPTSTNRRPLQ